MTRRLLNILLVEDNPDHAELARRGFEQFEVASLLHHVEDGEAALQYIFGQGNYADRSRFPAPDLVLLDLRLPRVDGIEVLRRVKTNPSVRGTPMVILTTSDEERDVAAAYEYHANGFVTKPVNFQQLSHVINGLGIEWLSRNGKPAPTEGSP